MNVAFPAQGLFVLDLYHVDNFHGNQGRVACAQGSLRKKQGQEQMAGKYERLWHLLVQRCFINLTKIPCLKANILILYQKEGCISEPMLHLFLRLEGSERNNIRFPQCTKTCAQKHDTCLSLSFSSHQLFEQCMNQFFFLKSIQWNLCWLFHCRLV